MWAESGLHQFQVVRCAVTGHRDRFGVDVDIVSPAGGVPAFIDAIMLVDAGVQVTPDDFPPVGAELEAVTLDFMPWGELRLSARPSSIARQEAEDGTA